MSSRILGHPVRSMHSRLSLTRELVRKASCLPPPQPLKESLQVNNISRGFVCTLKSLEALSQRSSAPECWEDSLVRSLRGHRSLIATDSQEF